MSLPKKFRETLENEKDARLLQAEKRDWIASLVDYEMARITFSGSECPACNYANHARRTENISPGLFGTYMDKCSLCPLPGKGIRRCYSQFIEPLRELTDAGKFDKARIFCHKIAKELRELAKEIKD